MTFREALQSDRALLSEPTQQISLQTPLAPGRARALPAEPTLRAYQDWISLERRAPGWEGPHQLCVAAVTIITRLAPERDIYSLPNLQVRCLAVWLSWFSDTVL